MNNQGNKGCQKENKKSPENKLKVMEYCDLNDRLQFWKNDQSASMLSIGSPAGCNLGIWPLLKYSQFPLKLCLNYVQILCYYN